MKTREASKAKRSKMHGENKKCSFERGDDNTRVRCAALSDSAQRAGRVEILST